MIHRLAERFGLVFALVFAWKLALLIFTSQPVPANDSFFYDGAVVNYLNGGGYCNPALALALPISGKEIFCAYPPLYQGVLLGWMSLFGTSALSAMWLHLLLFGLYLLVLLGIFSRLKTPPLWINLAGLFLFVITFQDRPDSLAHLLGMGAIYAWVRASQGPGCSAGNRWDWLMASLVVLTLATSLQIGAVYLLWIWMITVAMSWARKAKFPLGPIAAAVLVPASLVALVKFRFPGLWEGFMEHATQTPTFIGWHWPRGDEVLKALRNVPGVLGAGVMLLWLAVRGRWSLASWLDSSASGIALTGAVATAAVVAGGLFFLAANFVIAAVHLQPLVVGCFLTACSADFLESGRRRLCVGLFLVLAALGAVRAVGMSTWGVACAADVNRTRAEQLVRQSLNKSAPASMVALSSAYLYEAARHKELHAIHADWLLPARHTDHLTKIITARRPALLILTQFDYYRRYVEPVRQLQDQPGLVTVTLTNTARLPSPDASRLLQKVVQHVSWAPVIVEFSWK